MELVNDTPFVLDRFALFDRDGAEILVALVKATYELSEFGRPTVAREQAPAIPADEYHGAPGASSIKVEGDFSPPRPTTGATLTGHAWAPNEETTHLLVTLRVGPVRQRAAVFGDRVWEKSFFSMKPSAPTPFKKLPLTWENAYGGADQSNPNEANWDFERSNPVGRGFLAARSGKSLAGEPLPNVEHPDQLLLRSSDRPTPVGFGPIAGTWQPRASFAGTYDEEWHRERAPLVPPDFDDRFHQAAPPALTCPGYLAGGEFCEVTGTTPQGRLTFELPADRPVFNLHQRGSSARVRPNLDSVHVDTDAMRLRLTWKAAVRMHGRLETLRTLHAAFEGGRR
jgi:hypothetical protein